MPNISAWGVAVIIGVILLLLGLTSDHSPLSDESWNDDDDLLDDLRHDD